jgi:DNA-binding transcriptional MerR regulator
VSVYSIKDLEQLSGIKAHTLRVWEQRYNFIKPQRTDTNIRYYSEEDLKLILNISLLKDNGHKISKICKMRFEDMHNEVLRITERKLGYPEQIHALTLALLDLDEDRFEKIMSTNILQFGFERTMLHIINPFMVKIGVLWQTESISPAQEHFITNLIRQKVIVAIDGQVSPGNDYNYKYMLFLPEGELHELTLLFSSYIIKSRKNKLIYLGQSLPIEDAKGIFETNQPDFVLTVSTSYPNYKEVQSYVNKLPEMFPAKKVLISGAQVVAQGIQTPPNVIILNKIQDLIDFVEEQNYLKELN